MRRAHDPDLEELTAVLRELLANRIPISAREVARRHSSLKNASDFTRNPRRRALIDEFLKAEQKAAQEAAAGDDAGSVPILKTLRDRLARQEVELDALRRQNRALVSSYAQCIAAVKAHGGMDSLSRFWKAYGAIAENVRNAGVEWPQDNVVPLSRRPDNAEGG